MGGQAAVSVNVWRPLKRRDPAPRCVGGVARRLTPELLDEIREFIEEEHGRIASHCLALAVVKARRLLRLRSLVIRTVPYLQDRHIRDLRNFAEEMLAKSALASGRRISKKINKSTSGFGRDLSMDTPRLDVACSDLSPDLSPSNHTFLGFERGSGCIGFVILSSLSTSQQMCHLILRLTLATTCT